MSTLAELRQASLREQKKEEASSPVLPSPAPSPAASAPLEHLPVVLPLPPPEPPAVLEPRPTLTVADLSADAAAECDPFVPRVRAGLTRKIIHPTGAKATVDMSPALFHRAKRYCLDHGNITLRQVFLDLMTAFLEEEGY